MQARTIANLLIECFERGNKVLICGNGGSAAEAQHFAGELVCTFEVPRKALPAIALTTDTSIITAWSNDNGFTEIFSRQIEALGKKGDILIVLSTSGESANCFWAQDTARDRGLGVIEFPIKQDGESTAHCQERHLKLIHQICRIIDQYYEDRS